MLTKKPKTLKECYRLDETSLNLRGWSESLFRRGDLFFKIHLAVGVAGFFILLTLSSQYRYDSLDVILCGVAIGFLLLCLLVGVIVRAILRTLSILVSAKAHIVHNTRVTANIALFEANKNFGDSEDEETAESEEETSEELKEFINEIEKLDTYELALVWNEQKDLYDDEEINAIEQELKRRTDWP